MATIKTNIGQVTERIKEKLARLSDKEYIPRTLSFDLIDQMTKRIHIDGKDSTDGQIGTYSKGYMALRTGSFQNSERFSKGKNKGKIKNAGVVTKKLVQLFGTTQNVFADVSSIGKQRANYNRSSDTKIIVSLTRQLENDWNVIATDKGYGIGFLNPHNFDKARWVEANKGKKIFFLSASEQQYVNDTVTQLVKDALA